MSMELAGNNIFWQSKVHMHSHKDVFGHRSLPTSVILALGLLEKKEEEEDDEQICVGGDNAF